jgi:hypothetical protein
MGRGICENREHRWFTDVPGYYLYNGKPLFLASVINNVGYGVYPANFTLSYADLGAIRLSFDKKRNIITADYTAKFRMIFPSI